MFAQQDKTKSAQNTVNLLTTTVKADAEEGGEVLRFCFRVVAPDKSYTLQADNEMDRRDWMEALQVCMLPSTLTPLARSTFLKLDSLANPPPLTSPTPLQETCRSPPPPSSPLLDACCNAGF